MSLVTLTITTDELSRATVDYVRGMVTFHLPGGALQVVGQQAGVAVESALNLKRFELMALMEREERGR